VRLLFLWYKDGVNTKKPKVFVGVSGGVDSSVALALLQKEGYDVTGVFLKVWSPDFLPCDWREERRSAMKVCATLGVPFLTLDCEAEYKKEVVDYMVREYSEGRVPNPDVYCNKYVKFGVFLKKALEMGADFVATGHYAGVKEISFSSHSSEGTDKSLVRFSSVSATRLRSPSSENDSTKSLFELHESIDKEKDQSYFLYTLNQEQLSHTLFPVGGMTKPEVRKLAKKFGLPTAEKKDSQGLCFIGKIDMKDFLSHYIPQKEGDVLNTKGEVVGTHDGAMFFTIGQRHGFTITKKTPDDPRFFVVSKDIEKNTITVAGKEKESSEIYDTKEIIVKNVHSISGNEPPFPLKTSVRIRYRQEKQACVVEKKSDGCHVTFENPQNGVAVGQSAVLYDGEVCLGGGIIEGVME
jgi:tRNA-uridine 2-sulfurtransferase